MNEMRPLSSLHLGLVWIDRGDEQKQVPLSPPNLVMNPGIKKITFMASEFILLEVYITASCR